VPPLPAVLGHEYYGIVEEAGLGALCSEMGRERAVNAL